MFEKFSIVCFIWNLLVVESARKDTKKETKKEKRPQQPLISHTSPDGVISSKEAEEKKPVKTKEPLVAKVVISPEEKKQLKDKMVEQLMTSHSTSQACVLL